MWFPDAFVANKSRDEVNEGLAADFLQPAPDEVVVPYSPIAVNTGSKLVVIDTGTGEANFERSKGAAGQFHSNLKPPASTATKSTSSSSRISRRHINGLLTRRQQAAFPNAEILVPAAEWKYFRTMPRWQADHRSMKGEIANCAACSTRSAAR